jgi:phytoene dehydrogenase-like protein
MTLPREVDAVVIGAGPNGLVAANRLADAGWETLLLEAQPEVGGAVRSDRELHPDFISDTFSAFYPLGYASRVIRSIQVMGRLGEPLSINGARSAQAWSMPWSRRFHRCGPRSEP